MAANGLPDMVRRLRRLADPQATGVSDAELLERYARTRDEAAFELLLWRHGPMVHGVCRRLLRRTEDAEDAFQATFLTLVRKAASIRRGASLGAWLYQVAYRVAVRDRVRDAAADTPVAEPASSARCEEVDWRDLGPVLDEEVRRLPARYRDPVILCYLEGRTHVEAARELRCPKGTVAIRLSRARKLLQARLTRRGVTLAGCMPVIRPPTAAPPALVSRTLRTALGGPIPARVATLAQGAIQSMSLSRLKSAVALVALTAGVLIAGSAAVPYASPPKEAPAARPDQPAAPGTPALAPDRVLARVPALRDGQVLFVGTEVAPGEAVPADRRIVATVSYLVVPVKDGEPVKAEEAIEGSGSTRWRRWRDGDAIQSERIRLHKVQKEHKRLVLGDEIKAGQLVGRIDTTLAAGDLAIKIAALGAAESEVRVAKKTKEEAERRVLAMEASMSRVPGSVSRGDYEGARLTASRYREEEVAKNAAVLKIQHELDQANTLLKMHEIRSPVSGVIASIEVEPGDPVKALDTVLTVVVRSGPGQASAGVDTGKDRLVRTTRDGVLLGFDTEVVTPGNGKLETSYRRLRAGDLVEAGALIARLDDKLARNEVTLKEAQIRACEAGLRACIKAKQEAERRVTVMEESMKRVPGSVSKDDYENARLTASRYREEEVASRSRVIVAQAECERARTVVKAHDIRSPVRGVVRELLKVPGEAVRVGEPLVRLAVVANP